MTMKSLFLAFFVSAPLAVFAQKFEIAPRIGVAFTSIHANADASPVGQVLPSRLTAAFGLKAGYRILPVLSTGVAITSFSLGGRANYSGSDGSITNEMYYYAKPLITTSVYVTAHLKNLYVSLMPGAAIRIQSEYSGTGVSIAAAVGYDFPVTNKLSVNVEASPSYIQLYRDKYVKMHAQTLTATAGLTFKL